MVGLSSTFYLCLFGLLFYFTVQATAIGCFVCSSINNSTPGCEDTFNNPQDFYKSRCWASRKGRTGLFLATECIKLKGVISETGDTYVVRTCVVDNGDINSETEIGRRNHCGMVDMINYDDQLMRGCILSCKTDGCNAANTLHMYWPSIVNLVAAVKVLV